MEYEAVIGIEVHAQLKTQSKLFCGCSTAFGATPNRHTCPVCLGFPGVLPVANKKAIDMVIKTAVALHCEVAKSSRFARKNYYYPDLPKAFQISMYELPIGEHGYLEVEVNGAMKKIGIHRVHLEEDAGKLVHGSTNESMVDYNRGGMPLMEIVSEPDIKSPEEAHAYLTQLRHLLVYLDVCDGNMEEGSLRCEPNISIMPLGAREFGTKTELKNLNSFKAVFKGVEYEIIRQKEVLESGGKLVQATFRWDDATGTTQLMRTKEFAHDYRYFPEPDLVEIRIDEEWKNRMAAGIPELPMAKKHRFQSQYGLPAYDSEVLTSESVLADYFETAVRLHNDPKSVSNWIMTELLAKFNETSDTAATTKVTPEHLAQLLDLIKSGTISGKIGKDIFAEMYQTGAMPREIVEKRGLTQVSDEGELKAIAQKVIDENPDPVQQFRQGKEKAIGFLVGAMMKQTKGRANPQLVNKILKELLQS